MFNPSSKPFLPALLALFLLGNLACSNAHKRPVRQPQQWAESKLRRMSLTEKVGQLILASAPSRFRPLRDQGYTDLIRQVRQGQVGGLVLGSGTPHAQSVLVQRLQRETDLPLFFAQDVEHGVAMRIQGATEFPSMMALGAADDPQLAERVGRAIALECQLLGINLAFAPVLDLHSNPDNPVINVRSLGERPARVAKLGQALISGFRAGGVLAIAKHFPGHGNTHVDSHFALPILDFDREQWQTMEALPFQAAVDHGIDGIMLGHLAWPAVDDSGLPATLSANIADRLLRQKWGFEGLVITDAMNMRGLTQIAEPGEAAAQAVMAGADLIIMPPDLAEAHSGILEAVNDGRIPLAVLEEKVIRVLQHKARFAHLRQQSEDLIHLEETLNHQDHQALAQQVAGAGLTFVGNPDVLNRARGSANLVHISYTDRPEKTPHKAFQRLLDHYSPAAISHYTITQAEQLEPSQKLWSELGDQSIVVFSLFSKPGRTIRNPALITAINRLLKTADQSILIHGGHPDLPAALTQPTGIFLTYGSQRVMLEQTARVLFGKDSCSGRLPVRMPGRFPFGAGMDIHPGLPTTSAAEREKSSEQIDGLLEWAIDQGIFPGAVVAIGNRHGLRYSKAYGFFDYQESTIMSEEARFDLASLTKIVATTTVAMRLLERQLIDLDEPVGRYLPAFSKGDKAAITIRDLLRHTSGFRPFYPFHRRALLTPNEIWRFIESDQLQTKPGERFRYSDFNMLILARLLSRVAETPWQQLCHQEVFEPLRMKQTGFLPTGQINPCVVPTELDDSFRHRLIQGEVHDEAASLLGGVAGHAGLFSNIQDLTSFVLMILNDGETPHGSFVRAETLGTFTSADGSAKTRALGWDTRGTRKRTPGGHFFSETSFGHTGFTGTSLWLDRDRQNFIILLTNRVHPSRAGKGIVSVRVALADIVANANL